MPNALGTGLLGPLQVRDKTRRPVHVGGPYLRVLLTLLALNAGRVVPAGLLVGKLWPRNRKSGPRSLRHHQHHAPGYAGPVGTS